MELYFLTSPVRMSGQLLSCVSAERQEAIARLAADEKRRASLSAALLLRYALETNGIDRSRLVFLRTEEGKPFLKGSEVEFSLSHSAGGAAVAISEEPVGADLERIREADLSVARLFSPPEREYIGENRRRFFEIWTKKEAFMKCDGRGLRIPLSSFCVLDPPIAERLWFSERDNFAVSVCSFKAGARISVHGVSPSELERFFLPV